MNIVEPLVSDIKECPITGDLNYINYLNLGKIPLINGFCNTKEESLNCDKYELQVRYFKKSKLSTLSKSINPEILYSNYLYKSGVSQPYKDHCLEMFNDIKNNYFTPSSVLDIGGNDGTLLEVFKSVGVKNLLNIDMSLNLTEECKNKGIPAINKKWGHKTSTEINKKFNLIITTNCFQHTKEINSFVQGISNTIDEKGIWCLEFPYWKNSMETNQFDQVYHEHVYYYVLTPLITLFSKFNLEIFDISYHEIHGGTLRLKISKKEVYKQTNNCQEFIKQDKLINEKYYLNWSKDIKKHIDQSSSFLKKLKSSGAKIAGFGAAAKGGIYLNSAKIDHTLIDYVVDDTDLKQGKFIPGTGIEIVSREKLKTNPVDYILILAHNFSNHIINSLKDQYEGKFIILIPKIIII